MDPIYSEPKVRKDLISSLHRAQLALEQISKPGLIPANMVASFADKAADQVAEAINEAPGRFCYFCDCVMCASDQSHYTTRGNPVCKSCNAEMDAHHAQRNAQFIKELAYILEPAESRSSSLLRAPLVNFNA